MTLTHDTNQRIVLHYGTGKILLMSFKGATTFLYELSPTEKGGNYDDKIGLLLTGTNSVIKKVISFRRETKIRMTELLPLSTYHSINGYISMFSHHGLQTGTNLVTSCWIL